MAAMETGNRASFLLALFIAAAFQSDGTAAVLVRRLVGQRAALPPDEYFASLVDQLDDAVRGMGFYSLPIKDFTIELNQTVYGIELKGQISYTFGYVLNMDPYLVGKDSVGGTISYTDGFLRGYIDLPNIEVIYDFLATLTIGNFQGTATHLYPNNRIEVYVERNTTVQDSTPIASALPLAVSAANYTNYVPENNVTLALARVARLESGFYFWDDVTAWCNATFPPILQQIVDSMEFPL